MSYIARKKTVCFILISYLLISLLFSGIQSEEEEYSLKALYIKKINNYIEWSESEIKYKNSKFFKIGVIGKSPIYKTLKKTYKNQKLLNKNVKVFLVKDFNDLRTYNILFISNVNQKELATIIDKATNNNILLISDTKGFASYGIHINFYIKNDKLKFEINRNSLLDSGLSASSFLLSLAKIVNTKGDYK